MHFNGVAMWWNINRTEDLRPPCRVKQATARPTLLARSSLHSALNVGGKHVVSVRISVCVVTIFQ